jgi:hypothetical protein
MEKDMTYLVYNMETKAIFDDKRFAYKAVALRWADKWEKRYKVKLNAMQVVDYHKTHGNLTKKVRNLMTGQEVEENINTPYSCSVASEAYWSN